MSFISFLFHYSWALRCFLNLWLEVSHVTSEFDFRPVQGVRVQQDGGPWPEMVNQACKGFPGSGGLFGGCVGGGTLLTLE